MNILRLPRNTKMLTRFHYRSIDNSMYAPPGTVFPQDVLDRIDNWFEFTVSDISEFKSLITEIDLSSNNRFYTYTQSDLDWLLYCEPHRIKARPPCGGEIVEVNIDSIRYKAIIQIPTPRLPANYSIRELLIKAIIVIN